MKLLLKLLAPYFAVAVFWCGLSNAWLAILVYHAQILFWSRGKLPRLSRPDSLRSFLFALSALFIGPILYFLLPIITHSGISTWLEAHHLSKETALLMIPYFGLIHPILEQTHWEPLRKRTPLAHPLFAGYHLLVLYSLLPVLELVLCFVFLTGASCLWQRISDRTGSPTVSVLSHTLTDLGMIIAAWLRM